MNLLSPQPRTSIDLIETTAKRLGATERLADLQEAADWFMLSLSEGRE
jgi:hypothetical protein